MKIDTEKRIAYGSAWIREMENWKTEFPQGPVRWNVWDSDKKQIGENIRADELQNFLVAKNLLILW